MIDGLSGFSALPSPVRERIAKATSVVQAPRGRTLFVEGAASESLWAVAHGLIHILKRRPDGRRVVLDVIPPGELFGAVVALEDRPYPATAVAAKPSIVWRMPATLARDLCREHAELRGAILSQVTGRLRSAHDRVGLVALDRVERRLGSILLVLARKIGRTDEGKVTSLDVTRQDLADMVGTTVETTIRIISRWQKEQIVSSSRGQIRLEDPAALVRIAGQEPGRAP